MTRNIGITFAMSALMVAFLAAADDATQQMPPGCRVQRHVGRIQCGSSLAQARL